MRYACICYQVSFDYDKAILQGSFGMHTWDSAANTRSCKPSPRRAAVTVAVFTSARRTPGATTRKPYSRLQS